MGVSFSLSELGKNTFTVSCGDWAKQANGSVVVSYGDTVVLCTACASKEAAANAGFLPLFVDYQERTYAMGKIPGGFFKREGRPKDTEILCARLIDRPLRPIFPKGLTNEIQIVAMVLSSDGKNDPDVLAINGASCALFISDIPFDNPVAAVRVSQQGDKLIVNPNYEEREKSPLDLVVVGTKDKIIMLEGVCKEVKEETTVAAIKFAHPFIKKIISLMESLKEKSGKPKKNFSISELDKDLMKLIKDKVYSSFDKVYGIVKKEDREEVVAKILSSLYEELLQNNPDISLEKVKEIFFYLEEEFVCKKILEEEKRPDSRTLKEIRHIDCRVGVLPRTHGSAVFTRGQTQSLAVTTLGSSSDEQMIEALEGEKTKHFMLHYSFPPFSVGEIKPLRGPSRREIGHGALAEKALINVLPSKEEFPYTIRVVSEILESNGSSSMATVCATSLSLMDAGVPVKEPVAGIAIGLAKRQDNYKILTDIAGVEDYYGEMDFKVAGTKNGITAIQLDMKIEGLDYNIIEESLERAKEARLKILEDMQKALSLPREVISKYAPKIKTFKIDVDKIGAVIGPGGRTIKRMTREYNATIDIDDDLGIVSVAAETDESLGKVVNLIVNLTSDIEIGNIYEAKIERIVNFGAFAEILPGKSGLIHVSEFAEGFVKDVHDFIKEGDIVRVKVVNIDPQGKISLSIKQVKEA